MRASFVFAAMISTAAFAHGPPQEALAACAGKADGATCSVTFDGKSHDGVCRTGPGGEAVACLPNDLPPGGRHHGPPPAEAVSACTGKVDGATCSFKLGDRDASGTCRTGPRGETAACRPDHGPGGPGGHHGPPQEALAACAGKTAGTACSFTKDNKTASGICQNGPRGEVAACMPPRP